MGEIAVEQGKLVLLASRNDFRNDLHTIAAYDETRKGL